jgi:hypothetical protein
MFKKLLLMVTASLALMAVKAPTTTAESALDFTLVNKTGYAISAVYIGPSSSKEWGENILDDVLGDGESATVTFHPKADSIAKWDLRVSWEDEEDPDVYWLGFQLATIHKITLKYDRNTNKTTAVTE